MGFSYRTLMDNHNTRLRAECFDGLDEMFKRLMISADNADELKSIVHNMCMNSYKIGLEEIRELRYSLRDEVMQEIKSPI